ncbi:GDSL esterase/lipase At5g22810-like [Humulus lupulus]|uniref:GDSL esterase/lipase At5g22810-like n=1 Tax=Humulus lupulus TaxID=3486 RepID=UPI002B4054BC|nr:GDSL esterase/lipase At5g22810-like [Humulus lupulus]
MASQSYSVAIFGTVILVILSLVQGQPLVPALFIFGDSVVDVGNNNQLATIIRANFPPYGRDFVSHRPTGRFSNGKLATDFTAEMLGFSSYPPAYLSRRAIGRNLLIGANFASAASGYFDPTANIYHSIPLTRQLGYYRDYQGKVVSMVGSNNASSIFSNGIYLISSGSSDFLQNYYINPLLHNTYTIDQFFNILFQNVAQFIEELYGMGARKIGVTTLPPMGCLPAAITLFGSGSNQCVERINNDAISFNTRLNSTAQNLQNRLSGLNLVVLDIYTPLRNLIAQPAENGFSEARRGCCGSGLLETSLLCNRRAIGTCNNASEYVFWDAYHPSEAANKILANALISAGLSLV